MRGALGIDPGWGITPVRIVMGLIFVVAGYTKLAVTGLPAVTAAFAKYAIPLTGIVALLIAFLVLVGGLLLLGGFGTRLLGVLFTCAFVVITFWVKVRTLWRNYNSLELLC